MTQDQNSEEQRCQLDVAWLSLWNNHSALWLPSEKFQYLQLCLSPSCMSAEHNTDTALSYIQVQWIKEHVFISLGATACVCVLKMKKGTFNPWHTSEDVNVWELGLGQVGQRSSVKISKVSNRAAWHAFEECVVSSLDTNIELTWMVNSVTSELNNPNSHYAAVWNHSKRKHNNSYGIRSTLRKTCESLWILDAAVRTQTYFCPRGGFWTVSASNFIKYPELLRVLRLTDTCCHSYQNRNRHPICIPQTCTIWWSEDVKRRKWNHSGGGRDSHQGL